jgi:uncharacterized protein YgiM (DUF1202 family)
MSMRLILVFLLGALAVTAAHATEATAHKPAKSPPPGPKAVAATRQSTGQKQAPAQDSDAMWVRLSRQATLRDGPSVHARVLAEVDLGSEAKVMWRRRDGWVQIKLPASSLVGWTREKNLPLATTGSAGGQVHASSAATAEGQTNAKLEPASQKHARIAGGRKHRRSVASSHRNRRRDVAEPQWGKSNWRGAYAHFRTFGYRYY